MTVRHQIELETVSLMLIAVFIGSFFVWYHNAEFSKNFLATSPIVSAGSIQNLIVPTLSPINKIEFASQISPNGTKNLSMSKTHHPDGSFTYVFNVSDVSGSNKKELFRTTAQATEVLSVPFNAWSPDDRYVFIQKNSNDGLVFKATGDEIIPGKLYLDIVDIFADKVKTLKPRVVTGWASETLLLVNTINENNTVGPSYWLEIPSMAAIQLSTLFE